MTMLERCARTTPEQRAREMLASVMNKPLVAEHVARGGPGTPVIKVSVAEAIRGMIAFAEAEQNRITEEVMRTIDGMKTQHVRARNLKRTGEMIVGHAVSQWNIAIGWRANYYLATESYTLCIGRDTSTPRGHDYWIKIKDLYDGPVTDDVRVQFAAWLKRVVDTRGDGTGSLMPWFNAIAEIADLLGPEVTREKVLNAIHESVASLHSREGY
jgi:hypothetical protein